MKKLVIIALLALTWYLNESLMNETQEVNAEATLACVPCNK